MMTCTHLAAAVLAMAVPAAAFMPAGPALAGRSLLRPAASSLARPLGALPSRRTPAGGPARLNMRSAPPGVDFTTWDTPENPPSYYATTRAPRYSSMDWLDNIKSWPRSRMLWRIRVHLMVNIVWAAMVYTMFKFLPAFAEVTAGFSPLPHSLTAGALSLMLVFRTNSAYDRFWEARKLWGQLVNLTRECGRFGHTVLTGLDRDHYLAMVAAFPSFLLQHLQGKENAYRPTKATFSEKQRTVLSGLLGETDMKILWACRHRPFMVTKMMSGIMMKGLTSKEALVSRFGPINPDGTPDEKFHAMVVQSQLTAERAHFESLNKEFSGVYGACERLIKSSVPPSYSRHTSRFLSLWCFTLPIVLVNLVAWRVIPMVAMVCWALFVIEEVGHAIEDPFNMHTLDPMWYGQENQLMIEASLEVLKMDVMERLPAMDPAVIAEGKKELLIGTEYSFTDFHEEWKKAVPKA